jgi:1,4-dihydroxy-2-naphthoate octaprenyltransferase
MYLDMLKIIKLGRPQFLFGGFLLFTMGALLAVLFNAPFSSDKFIFGYFILALALLALHYSNDYFDMNADQFIKPTPISGGSGILIENPNLRNFQKSSQSPSYSYQSLLQRYSLLSIPTLCGSYYMLY